MKNIKAFFTRKNIIIISAVILSVAVAGFSAMALTDNLPIFGGEEKYTSKIVYPGTPEPESDESVVSEQQNENVIQNTETVTSQPSVSTNQVQSQKPLFPEEIAMREEIAKVSDTTIEFPYTRQIEFDGVTYSAVYNRLVESEKLANTYRAEYTTDNFDRFEYDLSTGKLMKAFLVSLVIGEKPIKTISVSEAEMIAKKFYNELNISGYTFEYCKENSDDYLVRYATPYYDGYPTDDCIIMTITNDGKIKSLRISDFHYDNLNLNISDEKVQAKMQDPIYQTGEEPWAVLSCSKGKICLEIWPVKDGVTAVPIYPIEDFLED